MKPIRTQRLILRRWEERDRPLFHRINSDDQVMRFFPVRRSRAQSDAVMDHFLSVIDENGFGFTAAEIAETGETIGFIGLQPCDVEADSYPNDAVEIGWRLAPEFWGEGYATEGASAWLDYGFQTAALDEIISLAVWNNDPSTAVMKRLGMRYDEGADFDNPKVPDTHPHLKRHVVYRISREEWFSHRK